MLREIKQQCERFPERNAFCFNDEYTTYRQFEEMVCAVKASFEEKLSPETRLIGIVPHEDLFTYASIFAVFYSGLGFVPLHPNNPADRNAEIIRQSGVRIILSGETNTDMQKIKAEVFPDVCLLTASDLQLKSGSTLSVPAIDEASTAYLFFTSGSTGIPKGVPISYGNLHSFIDAFFALGYEISENDRFLQMFDLSFDLSHMCYIIPLMKGACCYPVSEEGIKYMQVFSLLEDKEITVALMVPSVLSYLRNYLDDVELPAMRYSMFCGEALYNDLTAKWQQCVPNALVQNVYGPTEATIFCLTYDWTAERQEKKTFNGVVCIGKPMKNMDAIIVDEDLKLVPRGEKGEICLAGKQLTSGYLHDEEKNKKAFFVAPDGQKFYKTGDRGFIDDEGDFMFAGRVDHQVKVQGYRIELGEIEEFARKHTNCNVAAVAYDNEAGGKSIFLFVERYAGDVKEILNYLKNHIPEYMMPTGVRSMTEFPLNKNGKTDRKVLEQQVNN
jgi:amino acid adenylation domain-containing protein